MCVVYYPENIISILDDCQMKEWKRAGKGTGCMPENQENLSQRPPNGGLPGSFNFKVKHIKVDIDSRTSLIEAGARLTDEELPAFYRIKKSYTVYHLQLHSKQQGVRNSTICVFVDPSTGAICFGSILP